MSILSAVKTILQNRKVQAMIQDRARRDQSVNSTRTGFTPMQPSDEEAKKQAIERVRTKLMGRL